MSNVGNNISITSSKLIKAFIAGWPLKSCLQLIGESISADSICLFQIFNKSVTNATTWSIAKFNECEQNLENFKDSLSDLEGLVGRKQALFLTDFKTDAETYPILFDNLLKRKVKSIHIFPVKNAKEKIGYLIFENFENPFLLNQSEVSVVKEITQYIGPYLDQRKKDEMQQKTLKLYKSIVDTSTNAISIADFEGNYLFANQGTVDLLELENLDELYKSKTTNFIAPDSLGASYENAKRLFENGTSPNFRLKIITKNNRAITVNTSSSIIYDENGQPEAIAGITQSLEEQEKIITELEQSEKLYKNLAEAAQDIIFLIDHAGRYQYVNSHAAQLFNSSPEEMVGRRLIDFFPEEVASKQQRYIKKAIQKREPVYLEDQFPMNYLKQFLSVWLVPVSNSEGKYDRVLFVARDISHLKKVESELWLNKENYKLLVENQNDIILKADLKGTCLYASPSYSQLKGLPEKQIIGANLFEFIKWQDSFNPQIFEKFKTEPYQFTSEILMDLKDGPVWFEWAVRPIFTKGKNFSEIVAVGRNINERKKAEELIKETAQKYEKLFNNYQDAVLLYCNSRLVDINKTALKVFGLERSNVQNFNYWDIFPNTQENGMESEKFFKRKQNSAMGGRDQIFEMQYKRQNGQVFFGETRLHRFGIEGDYFLLHIVRDITDTKTAKEKVKSSEKRFTDSIERSLDGYYFFNKNGRINYINPRLRSMLFRKDSKSLKINISSTSKQDFIKILRNAFSEVMGGEPISWREIKFKKPSGETMWLGFNARRVVQKGIVQGVEGFVKDITAQKNAEYALTQSQARYKTLFDNIPYEIFGLDEKGRFLEANNEFQKNWGALQGITAGEVVPYPQIAGIISHLVTTATITRKPISNKFIIDVRGEPKSYNIIVSPILADGEIIGFVGINVDMTEINKAHEQTKHFSEMLVTSQEEERERISREIHDSLGQILTALKFEIGAVTGSLPVEMAEHNRSLLQAKKTVTQAIIEAQNICYNLRPHMLDDFGLVPTIQDYANDFSSKYDIQVHCKLGELDYILPKMYKSALFRIVQEAFSNILKHSKASNVLLGLENRNNHLELTIVDNGIGFNATNFKNKVTTSFGLLNIRERAEMLEGSFDIESLPSKGTTLKVKLPLNSKN